VVRLEVASKSLLVVVRGREEIPGKQRNLQNHQNQPSQQSQRNPRSQQNLRSPLKLRNPQNLQKLAPPPQNRQFLQLRRLHQGQGFTNSPVFVMLGILEPFVILKLLSQRQPKLQNLQNHRNQQSQQSPRNPRNQQNPQNPLKPRNQANHQAEAESMKFSFRFE